jgi:hypothetical protein
MNYKILFLASFFSTVLFSEPIDWELRKKQNTTEQPKTEVVEKPVQPETFIPSKNPTQFSTVTSTPTDRETLSITVYNQNMGIVREKRKVKLPAGSVSVRYEGVASQILPNTVRVKDAIGNGFFIYEQNYEYDLISSDRLLQKYVGKDITIHQQNPTTGAETPVKANLLSNNRGLVLKIGDQISLGYPGRISVPSIPDNLYYQPTLIWKLETEKESEYSLDVSYQTNGLNWKADYIMLLDADENSADINCWVTLENRSGTSFRSADLQLLAGQVNRASRPPRPLLPKGYRDSAISKKRPEPFSQEQLSEYYLYTLERPVDIEENQMKQVSLFSTNSVSIKKLYSISNINMNRPDLFTNASVSYIVENKKDNNLGRPIPQGTVRVFQSDSKGRQQLLGSSNIPHTPENERFTVKTGKAFDVVASGKRTSHEKKVVGKGYTESYEVSIRNRKKEAVKVNYYANIYGDWKFTHTSHTFTKITSNTALLEVEVKPDSEEVVTYSFEVVEGN